MAWYNTEETAAAKRRNVFFSFHYADVMRVNNVRMSGQFKKALGDTGKSIEGYYDKSLWEKKRGEGEQFLRQMIREGVERTSAICVLVGKETAWRPWVRYEIARSVVDKKGLLAVHINSIKHHEYPYLSDALGHNPNWFMGIAKKENGSFYLCERKYVNNDYIWYWYDKHTTAVDRPYYIPNNLTGPVCLADYTALYDWASNGHNNIGQWIDKAAQAAGR